MTAAPASDAEALSCAIAGRYAGRWARSVARGASGGEDGAPAPAPWFVDGFAGADLQRAALRGATPTAAAVIAVQALDDAAAGRARVVLMDEDPGLVARLAEELEAVGASSRVRIASDPASAEPGEIVLVEAPFASHAHRLAERMADGPALVRLAPLAARSLPWTALAPVARLPAADVLLRFPREDFEKQARFTGPLADLPPHLRRVVEGCSGFLGDARHGWLSAWRQAQREAGPDAALATAVERMQALLAAGGERFTHALRVEGEGGPVHLLLCSPHAERPLELNGAVADEGVRQKPPPRRKPAARAKVEPPRAPASLTEPAEPPPTDASPAPEEPRAAEDATAVLDLFALPAEPEPEPRGPDLAAFANDLHARHLGARVPVRDLLAGVADSGLAPEQVRAALASLKRAGRVSYRSLDAEGAEVEFLAQPRVAAPRPRRPRKPASGELGLFDEPEE
ncbi:MAG: hypothetical protein KY467_16445 [Gemmatimonadetes bacterium]|nr:hypothetical protein [Gemmatimonadota bacterium]